MQMVNFASYNSTSFMMRQYLDMPRSACDPSLVRCREMSYRMAFMATLLFSIREKLLDEIEVEAYSQYLMGVKDEDNVFGESNVTRFLRDFEEITTVLYRHHRIPNVESVEALMSDIKLGDDVVSMERNRISFVALRLMYQVAQMMGVIAIQLPSHTNWDCA